MLPSTAREAKSLGLTRYFTGAPCRYGHVSERSAATRGCVACLARLSAECRLRNYEKTLASDARKRDRRREEIRAYSRQRYRVNRTAVREATKSWESRNKPMVAAKTARRKAAMLRAMPRWVDESAILPFYEEARRLSAASGVPHEVDHIHPLQGENVCGLHVPWNLQILTKSENSRKKNRLIDAALNTKGGE